jgi:hypothetical protein
VVIVGQLRLPAHIAPAGSGGVFDRAGSDHRGTANRPGPRIDTLRNLLPAWVLTLSVSVLPGAGIFAFGPNVAIRPG